MTARSFVIAAVLFTLPLQASQPAAVRTIALRAARVLDPVSGRMTPNGVIVVREDKIESVAPSVPAGADVVDLGNLTLMPGLIDGHTPVLTKSQSYRTIEGVRAVKLDLEAGFTTMRDLDSEGAGFADVALRDAINKGIIPGPRLLVATYALTITGGHMNLSGMNPDITLPDPASLTDSREAMIQEIRREVKYGADWIKLYATGTLRHVDPVTLEPLSQVSVDDVRAVVAEATRWRKDVAAHAYGGPGARAAVEGGVRSLEHGMMLDDDLLRLMAARGTYWCPTLSVYMPEAGLPDPGDITARIVASHKRAFQSAMKAGVKIVFGTDVGAFPHGTSAREFVHMVNYGMPAIEAIRSATTRAAELLRMERHVGTLAPGAFADVIAVDGDPLADITSLQRVRFVMKGGAIVKRP
jgi:imidazolonepropionase-like amidohydrolase